MKVLLTGGNGFLGSHIAERLTAGGHELRLSLRPTSDTAFLGGLDFERVDADVRSAAAMRLAVAGVDAVVHNAGLTTARSVEEFDAVNEHGTRLVAQAAADAGVRRFVYVSSLAAQGPSPDARIYDPMDVEPAPRSPYGRSKLAGERQVMGLSGEMAVVSLRCPVIYGPRDRAMLPFYRLVRLRLMPLYGKGEHELSWVYVKDAAAAIAGCLEASAPSGAIYTVSDGGRHTWRSLATLLGEALGHQPLKLPIPGPLFALGGWAGSAAGALFRRPVPLNRHRVAEFAQPYWICGHERISRDVGWEPSYSAPAGIRETVAWYKEHRWL